MSITFEHIQLKGDGSLLSNYKFPEILNNTSSNSMRPFVPATGCLYLSKVNQVTGIGAWRKRCQDHKDREWLDSPVMQLSISQAELKKNILIIETPKQFQKLFTKYAIYKTETKNSLYYQTLISNERDYYQKILALLDYIETFKDEIRNKLDNLDEILPILSQIKHSNTIIYSNKFLQDQYIIKPPKAGKTFKHFCNVIKELKSQYDKLYNCTIHINFQNYHMNNIQELDYQKIKEDGYSGIYFTQGLINRGRLYFCQRGEEYFKSFLEWFDVDTLIIWNWCFQQN